jgi:hypothetical protein
MLAMILAQMAQRPRVSQPRAFHILVTRPRAAPKVSCQVMDTKAMLRNAPPLHQERPAEPAWSLSKDARRVDAQLRGHGEDGWEIQLLRDGGLYFGRRFHLREDAIAYGDELRRAFEKDGYQSL